MFEVDQILERLFYQITKGNNEEPRDISTSEINFLRTISLSSEKILQIVRRASSWYVVHHKGKFDKLSKDYIGTRMIQLSLGYLDKNGLIVVNPKEIVWMSSLLYK